MAGYIKVINSDWEFIEPTGLDDCEKAIAWAVFEQVFYAGDGNVVNNGTPADMEARLDAAVLDMAEYYGFHYPEQLRAYAWRTACGDLNRAIRKDEGEEMIAACERSCELLYEKRS